VRSCVRPGYFLGASNLLREHIARGSHVRGINFPCHYLSFYSSIYLSSQPFICMSVHPSFVPSAVFIQPINHFTLHSSVRLPNYVATYLLVYVSIQLSKHTHTHLTPGWRLQSSRKCYSLVKKFRNTLIFVIRIQSTTQVQLTEIFTIKHLSALQEIERIMLVT
jgi:hypothetical protein